MIISDIRFDSRSETYKKPVGAIPSGTELTLRIAVDPGASVSSAMVVMRYDRHEQPAYYDMHIVTPEDSDRRYDWFEATFPIYDRGIYWYHFVLHNAEGQCTVGCKEPTHEAAAQWIPSQWQQTVYQRDFEEPSWAYGGVYYQIFVDRFCHAGPYVEPDKPGQTLRKDWGGTPEYQAVDGKVLNNDFFGGNLKGIREKLPYLEDLGVTCLYLSPIFEAYSNHKYDTADYQKIDPMFGTEEDLKDLCQDAAERGIHVILDGVFSHTGSDSVYFNKDGHYGSGGAWNDPESPYRSWYTFLEDGTYKTWWGIQTLPTINKLDPDYRKFICGEDGVVRRWLKAGISGWRLDVVDELPACFLEELARSMKEYRPDSLLIGEVWEDASNKVAYEERKNYFEGNKLDTVMNYPLRTAILDYIRYGDAISLDRTVLQILENYPPFAIHTLMNFIGTHDSIRAITALAGEELPISFQSRSLQAQTVMSAEERTTGILRMKEASLLQMSLPGMPCIYYGDEAGVEGYADPFNRGCYPWGGENEELREWYRRIIHIRRAHRVFRQGGYRTLCAEEGLFAFVREDEENVPMMTVLHRGEEMMDLELEGTWQDLLAGESYSGCIHVAPDTMYWLELK